MKMTGETLKLVELLCWKHIFLSVCASPFKTRKAQKEGKAYKPKYDQINR